MVVEIRHLKEMRHEMRHWRMVALDIWVIITAMKSYGHMYIVETNFKGDRQVVAHFRS